MMYRYCFALFLCISFSFTAKSQLSLDFETGIAFNTRNKIRFPNNSSSTASFVDIPRELGIPQAAFVRARASYTIRGRHTISALYAPLKFRAVGNFSRPVEFGNFIYSSGEQTTVDYKFNSYRLTYRYKIVDRDRITVGIGATGKIRDARIAFSSGDKQDETTDLGFVPLINFRVNYMPYDRWTFVLSGDALVGTQGRAEDVFIGAEYRIKKPVSVKAGYRILEGGADIDQVYNFSLIHYASVGAVFNF